MWLVTTTSKQCSSGNYTKYLISINFFKYHRNLQENITCIPIFQIKKMRLTEFALFAQSDKTNDCTVRNQLWFWQDCMLETVALYHCLTWTEELVDECKFFGGYSMNSGFHILFFPPFYFPPTNKYMQTHTIMCWTNSFELSSN